MLHHTSFVYYFVALSYNFVDIYASVNAFIGCQIPQHFQINPPNKFRHGHAIYAPKNAKDVPVLKAVSQNLMHSILSITGGVYRILSDSDIGERITALGKKKIQGAITREELLSHLETIVAE